jgi:hypothetical protein
MILQPIIMTFWKLIKIIALLFFVALPACSKFEREQELIQLLTQEAGLKSEQLEDLRIFVLQDNICGACTDSILNFISQVNHSSSFIIVSDKNMKVLNRINATYAPSQVFIDQNNLVGRYGMRFAKDVVIVLKNKKVHYWAFLKEDNLHKIQSKI